VLQSSHLAKMAEELSKSAKRRAAKKARDEAFDANKPAAPAPNKENSSKAANAKVEQAKPKAKAEVEPKAKAKAEAKAKAKAEPEPKAKAKAKAEAKKEEVKPAAKPQASKPEPKQAAKGKAQPKQAAKPVVEEPKPEKTELVQPYEIDDGSGDGWEQSTGLSKKAEKRQQKAIEIQQSQSAVKNQKHVPGLGPADQHIPGMAPKLNQAEINAVLKSAAAAGAAARAAIEAQAAEEKAKESNQSTATVKVPEAKIGVVIGPKGSMIKLIQEKTGARIDTSGEVFTMTGAPPAVAQAEAAIKELIEKGYSSMAFDDFQEEQIAVHPSCFPDLIGKQGATIKAMKQELGVEVKIPETQKSAPPSKKYKVTFAGKKENVQKAKEVVDHIVMYGYHEITHPGFGHQEIEVPQWAYSFLIGKAGSELRHIQNNYKVKVNIPREHSACQQVVVVGEKQDVERAKTYIEKLLWNAENASKGRDKSDGSIDTWGDEEEEEDWMKSYLYKRR